MLVVYGVNEGDETITPLTHLALLTSEEAQKVELWDFFREDEDTPARFEGRLAVVDRFDYAAQIGNRTAAQYLSDELIGSFLWQNAGRFFPFLPQREVAYVGSVEGGHVRALARERAWAVDVVQDLCGPPGLILTRGVAEDPEKAKAQALEAAYRVLRAL